MIGLPTWTVLVLTQQALAQQIGRTPEVHPKLTTETCTAEHGCVPHGTSLVLDAQYWRAIEDIHTGASCVTDSFKLNKTICPTVEECARNCALEGANYTQTGVQTDGDASVTLHMYQRYHGQLETVSPQLYLLDEGGKDYSLLQLLNQEVSFDVDVSKAPCGMDCALYLVEMDASGGRSRLNPAGATYGTGYCDSQCWNGYAFVNGVANVHHRGACCNEMDLWEANARATQMTPHPCNVTGFYACEGSACGTDGVCDRPGCGFNPYSLGAHHFYGTHDVVDTTKPFRVVTQLPTAADGSLTEIRRLYIQNDRLIHNAVVRFVGQTFDSITPAYCKATSRSFDQRGGLPLMGEALHRGMVLVFGIWNDPGDHMNWLDAGSAGPCNKKEGKPSIIKANDPGTSVTFSNIRWGDLGSTFAV